MFFQKRGKFFPLPDCPLILGSFPRFFSVPRLPPLCCVFSLFHRPSPRAWFSAGSLSSRFASTPAPAPFCCVFSLFRRPSPLLCPCPIFPCGLTPPLRLLRSAGLPFARVFPISLSLSSRTVPAARIRPRAFLCPFPTCGQEKTRTDRLSGPFSLYENSLGKSLFSRKNLFRMAVFRPLSVCRRDSSHSVPNTPARSRSPTGPTASGG